MNCKTGTCSHCPFPAEYKTFGKMVFKHPVHHHHGSDVVLLKKSRHPIEIVRKFGGKQFERHGHPANFRVAPSALPGF